MGCSPCWLMGSIIHICLMYVFIAGDAWSMSYSYKYDWFNSEDLDRMETCVQSIQDQNQTLLLWCSQKMPIKINLVIEPGFAWIESWAILILWACDL